MRLDLKDISVQTETSNFFSSEISLSECKLIIIGADAIVHNLLKNRIMKLPYTQLTSEIVSAIYRDIPAHFALIFIEKKQMTVVSDPYGIIKIYYYCKDGSLVLTDSLHDFQGENLSLNEEALKYYFITGYTPSRHTYFKDIFKIEPCTLNRFEQSAIVDTQIYARFGEETVCGEDFLERFQLAISNVLDFATQHYNRNEIALSGGIDSTFLLMQMLDQYGLEDTALSAFKMKGLNQKKLIDNDYDLIFANKLAEMVSSSLTEVDYDFDESGVLEDFKLLRDNLGCEYAPAMGYVGYCKSVDAGTVLINGQNADSVLSFGGMGWPRFKGFKLSGLNGLFTRHFQFKGPEDTNSLMGRVAVFLRRLYYLINFPKSKCLFTRENYFLGLGLNPENRFYFDDDPIYQNIVGPNKLADWFKSEYIEPLLTTYKGLSDHALSVIFYNKTYMQGSANRSTVLSALLSGKGILMPFSSLEILELLTNLKPDWHYSFFGKYPNIEVGRKKINVPKYIINRQDPNDADSTSLLYKALTNNSTFNEYITNILENTNFESYEKILSKEFLSKIKNSIASIAPKNMPILMRFIWAESIIQKQRMS